MMAVFVVAGLVGLLTFNLSSVFLTALVFGVLRGFPWLEPVDSRGASIG